MLTAVRRHPPTFTVAELAVDSLSPSQYPGPPFSLAYLENVAGFDSRQFWPRPHHPVDRKPSDHDSHAARPCSATGTGPRTEAPGYMSQRSSAPDPPSSVPQRESPSLRPPSPSVSRPPTAQHAPSELPKPSEAARNTLPSLGAGAAGNRLPPLLTEPGPRSLGVHSILNPAHHDVPSPRQLETAPSSAQQASPTQGVATAGLPPILKRSARETSITADAAEPAGRGDRRILTPKSPGTRTVSSGGRPGYGGMPGHLSAGQSPSLRHEMRPYPTDPTQGRSIDIAPLPPPSSMGRGSISHPPYPSMDPAPQQGRRASMGRNPFAPTGDSPSTSHSSYSHFSQSSPVLRYGPSSLSTSLPPGPSRATVSLPPGQQSAAGLQEGQHDNSKGSYGISLPTEGGRMLLPVELDVEQASKTANEKRKRNAGASARFRQRRKEKERESSQTISALERNMRAIEEERNHYRAERDFFRDLYARQAGPHQLPQRPITPHAPMLARASISESPGQWQDLSRETSEPLGRNVRRRTGSYPSQYPGPPGPTAPPMVTTQSQQYSYSPPQQMPVLQNPFAARPPGPPGPPGQPASGPPPQQLPPQTHPPPSPRSMSAHDPFRRDMYSRSWNPGT